MTMAEKPIIEGVYKCGKCGTTRHGKKKKEIICCDEEMELSMGIAESEAEERHVEMEHD